MAKISMPIEISLAEVTIDVLQNIECVDDESADFKEGFYGCKNMMIDALRKVTMNDESVAETQQMLSFMHMMRNAKTHEECNAVYKAMDKLMWQIYDKRIMELHGKKRS